MKGIVRFLFVVLVASAFAQVALAQQGPGGVPGPAGPGWAGKSATPEQFKDKKARILNMIDARRTKLDQAKACVEAATTDEELVKCRPERPAGMGPGMRRGGMRGQQQQMPPDGPQQ